LLQLLLHLLLVLPYAHIPFDRYPHQECLTSVTAHCNGMQEDLPIRTDKYTGDFSN
jgi:hypothetical protein